MKRWMSIFRKTLREQLRSPWELALTLMIAPAFVLMYWLFFGGGSTSYTLLVWNRDAGPHGARLMEQIRAFTYPSGQSILKVQQVQDSSAALAFLRTREAAALLTIPEHFSSQIEAAQAEDGQPGAATGDAQALEITGDLTNPLYSVAAALTGGAADQYLRDAAGQPTPVGWVEHALGGSGTRSEFETYVPGLLVVAVVMMIFTASARAAQEVEHGGLQRLALTDLSTLEFLAGISAVQLLVGMAAVLLTFLTAYALGFRSQGPLWLAILIGCLSAFSVIGMGLIVASFARTTTEAFVFANFPMILMMFFSGAVFPVQRIPLFQVGAFNVALFDFLPQTHAVLALNQVLTLGSGWSDVGAEALAVFALSLVFFGLGVWSFGRRTLFTRAM